MSRDKNADNDWIIINFQRETNIRKGLIETHKNLITNYINAIIYNNAVCMLTIVILQVFNLIAYDRKNKHLHNITTSIALFKTFPMMYVHNALHAM